MVTTLDMGTFRDRLLWVLGDRKLTPWAESQGLNKGTVTRINQGRIPGPETLLIIARAENVSLDWLLDGVGSPWREIEEGAAGIAEERSGYQYLHDPIGKAYEHVAREDPAAARRRLLELLWTSVIETPPDEREPDQ